MSGFLFVVCATLLVGVACIDRRKVATTPQPALNFDLHSWAQGEWYTQSRYVPCRFSGSKDFSDTVAKSVLEGKTVTQQIAWRDGMCSTTTTQLTVLKDGCGVFIQKDSFGGMVTGDHVVVVYNPKKGYHISWGCTKTSIDGTCGDPWVLVKTRQPFPEKFVWECVVTDLKKLWDLSLTEMVIMSHKNPC